MSEQQEPQRPRSRRFRVVRRVPTNSPTPYADEVRKQVEQEDADRGTPEMNRSVNEGCMGCLRVTLLFLLIMIASIVATCAITRKGV
jgi:hypothetical protein